MDDLPETSSQFRGLLRAQINGKIDKKTDQIFQEHAFGLRRPDNFSIPLAFVLQTKCQKWTFRLRRPHTFADRHGRRIDRYVSKTDVWLETSSQFRFQMCPNIKNNLNLLMENGCLAWDVLTISHSLRVFSWIEKKTKKQKLPFGLRRLHNFAAGFAVKLLKMINCMFFWGAKRAFGVRRPDNFVFSPAFFFSP